MMPQVAGRVRDKYLEPMVSWVTPSWDQNYTPWVFPLQGNLAWGYPAYKAEAPRDVESLVVGLKA